jgi:hypothetical protein
VAVGQKLVPVVRHHIVQRFYNVFEGVGDFAPVAIVDAKERTCEIVHAFRALRTLTDNGVGLDPDQHSLVVIILAALP